MKKREITNKDVEQIFNNIIEQDALLSDRQVVSLISNPSATKSGNTVRRFFQSRLNTILISATIVFVIVAGTIIWVNSGHQTEKTMVQIDSISTKSAIVIANKTSGNNAQEVSVLKESATKADTPIIPPDTISMQYIYKRFDKHPQVFSIKPDKDTTIICKEQYFGK